VTATARSQRWEPVEVLRVLLSEEVAGRERTLTDRERQVLRLAGDGLSNAAIAAHLHLSEGTVRNYLSEAIHKLGTTNRSAAARLAHDRGWL